LPITQGLKPIAAEGGNEERFINFVPHLASELAPPPIKEGRPIPDKGMHQMNVEGSTRPAVTSTSNRSNPNHPSRQTNQKLDNSSGLQIPKHPQSRDSGEAKKTQHQPTNQLKPSPATQRPYVKCPSAMLCIPKENCDFAGVITEDTIADTPQLNALRVPLIPCINRAKAIVDVCCRDPNYKVMLNINNCISFHLL